MSDKKKKYRFTEKIESKGGKRSVHLAAASFVLFCIDALLSLGKGGKAGYFVGVVALVAMLLSVYGFYLGMKFFSEEKEASPIYPVIGTLASGIMAVCYLTVFLSGF